MAVKNLCKNTAYHTGTTIGLISLACESWLADCLYLVCGLNQYFYRLKGLNAILKIEKCPLLWLPPPTRRGWFIRCTVPFCLVKPLSVLYSLNVGPVLEKNPRIHAPPLPTLCFEIKFANVFQSKYTLLSVCLFKFGFNKL